MTEDTPTLTEILHLASPPGHSFQRPKKPIPKLKGPFEVVRCECGTKNTPGLIDTATSAEDR